VHKLPVVDRLVRVLSRTGRIRNVVSASSPRQGRSDRDEKTNLGLDPHRVSKMDGKLTDISESMLIGSGMVVNVDLGGGVLHEVDRGEGVDRGLLA
jgi:hypothetical protein